MANAGIVFDSVDLTPPSRHDVVMTSTFRSSHGKLLYVDFVNSFCSHNYYMALC